MCRGHLRPSLIFLYNGRLAFSQRGPAPAAVYCCTRMIICPGRLRLPARSRNRTVTRVSPVGKPNGGAMAPQNWIVVIPLVQPGEFAVLHTKRKIPSLETVQASELAVRPSG